MTIKVIQHSGTWLPQVDKLVPGASWDNSYTLEGSDGSGTTITETFNEHFTLVGTEPHDVAGKTADALRIESSGTVDIEGLAIGGGSYPSSSTYYLVRGIGPVELDSVFSGISTSSTLTSYNIP